MFTTPSACQVSICSGLNVNVIQQWFEATVQENMSILNVSFSCYPPYRTPFLSVATHVTCKHIRVSMTFAYSHLVTAWLCHPSRHGGIRSRWTFTVPYGRRIGRFHVLAVQAKISKIAQWDINYIHWYQFYHSSSNCQTLLPLMWRGKALILSIELHEGKNLPILRFTIQCYSQFFGKLSKYTKEIMHFKIWLECNI